MKICASCGASLPDGAGFCISCGSKEFKSAFMPDLNAPEPEKPKIEYDQYGRPIGQQYQQPQVEQPTIFADLSQNYENGSQDYDDNFSQQFSQPQYIKQYSEQYMQQPQYQQQLYGQQYQQPQYQQPQYEQPQYQQPQYEQPQYQQPQYEQPQYQQPQYEQPQYQQPQYEQPQYQQPQYEQPQYQQPQYEQPQYEQPQYEQPQYEQPQYQQPQYEQPQYQQPQYEQPQYEQPQYEQPQYEQPQYQQQSSAEPEQPQPQPDPEPEPTPEPPKPAAPAFDSKSFVFKKKGEDDEEDGDENQAAEEKPKSIKEWIDKIRDTKDYTYNFDQNDFSAHKTHCILAALGITFWVPYAFCSNCQSARYYANQGLLTLIIEAVFGSIYALFLNIVSIGFSVYSLEGSHLSIGGWIVIFLLTVVCFALPGFIVYNSIQNIKAGKIKDIPFLGKLRLIA